MLGTGWALDWVSALELGLESVLELELVWGQEMVWELELDQHMVQVLELGFRELEPRRVLEFLPGLWV